MHPNNHVKDGLGFIVVFILILPILRSFFQLIRTDPKNVRAASDQELINMIRVLGKYALVRLECVFSNG